MNATVLSLLLVLTALPAWAETTKVFPLSSSEKLPPDRATALEELTRALATSIDAEVSSVSLDDAAGLLDCVPATTGCLETVARSVSAQRLVFGTLAIDAEGHAKVTLTRFDVGAERVTRTFELVSTDWPAELVKATDELFGRAPSVTEPPPPIDVAPTPPPATSTKRGTTVGTLVLIGGGVAVAAVGTGFLISAAGIRDDVKQAPRNTIEDFERLVALEDKGRTRSVIGQVLVGVGGVAITVGVIRAFVQRRETRRADATAIRVVPTLVEGGAAIVLSVGAP